MSAIIIGIFIDIDTISILQACMFAMIIDSFKYSHPPHQPNMFVVTIGLYIEYRHPPHLTGMFAINIGL